MRKPPRHCHCYENSHPTPHRHTGESRYPVPGLRGQQTTPGCWRGAIFIPLCGLGKAMVILNEAKRSEESKRVCEKSCTCTILWVMKRKPCPSDLSDAQWKVLAPLIPAGKPGGRPRTADMREVVNGILYVLRNGCTWRALPHDLPPWGTVWWYFREWRREGTWERVHGALLPKVRQAGKRANTERGHHRQPVGQDDGKGGPRGYDAGKKVMGRKRPSWIP